MSYKFMLTKKIILSKECNPLSSKGCIYTFLNPVSYLDAIRHKDIFCKFDGIFVDGFLLVVAVFLLYGVKLKRQSFDFTSMASWVFDFAEKNNKTIYIIASKPGMVEKAIYYFHERFPKLQIAGYRNGYFSSDDDMKCCANHIVEVNPDYLIVGMGILKQEQFLIKVKEAGFKGVGFTCGGFIHQTARREQNINKESEYYPRLVDKFNLRFIYRMYKEPHTRKRYFKAAFLFPARFIWERIFGY